MENLILARELSFLYIRVYCWNGLKKNLGKENKEKKTYKEKQQKMKEENDKTKIWLIAIAVKIPNIIFRKRNSHKSITIEGVFAIVIPWSMLNVC